MKLITVPKNVVLKGETGEPLVNADVSFKMFLVRHLDGYVDTKTVSQLRQAAKVIDEIEAAKETIALEDEQYKLVKAACERLCYPHGLARQMLPYYDAVEHAEDLKK